MRCGRVAAFAAPSPFSGVAAIEQKSWVPQKANYQLLQGIEQGRGVVQRGVEVGYWVGYSIRYWAAPALAAGSMHHAGAWPSAAKNVITVVREGTGEEEGVQERS